jgi:hypothetical protein
VAQTLVCGQAIETERQRNEWPLNHLTSSASGLCGTVRACFPPAHSHKAPTVGHVIKRTYAQWSSRGKNSAQQRYTVTHHTRAHTASTICHDSSRPDLPHQSILDAGTTRAHAGLDGTSDNCQQEDVALSKEASVGAAILEITE